MHVVSKEIERRKERSSAIESEVKRLVIFGHEEMCELCEREQVNMLSATVVNVDAAIRLYEDAKKLIDDEIGFDDKFDRHEWTWFDYPNRENDLFRVERRWLIEQRKRLGMYWYNYFDSDSDDDSEDY